MFNTVTSVMVWIIICAVGVWHAAIHTHEKEYVTYPTCKELALDHPRGIAAEWVPRIGPHTVLGQAKNNIWVATNVTTISDAAYWKQHIWLDGDGDGILCESLNEFLN